MYVTISTSGLVAVCVFPIARSLGHTPRSLIYPFCTLLMNHNCSIHATYMYISIMYSKPLLSHTAQPQTMRCKSRAMFEPWGTLSTLTLHPTSLQYQIPSVPSEIECIPLSICNILLWQHETIWVHIKCTLTRIIPLLHFFWIALCRQKMKQHSQLLLFSMCYCKNLLYCLGRMSCYLKGTLPFSVFFMFCAWQTVLTSSRRG